MNDGCYCDYGADDACWPRFYDERMVKARKQHRCCECREPILPGETYQRIVGKWDEAIEAYKTCAHCAELRKEANHELSKHDMSLTFGDLACWYANKVSEHAEPAA